MSERNLSSWIEGFFYYTQESECPDNYLLWSALSVLSGAVQRHVYTKWVYYSFYPNAYVMLVGPPGVTHKGSAVRFARGFLRDIGVSIASQSITKEGLIVQMQRFGSGGNNALSVLSSEFGSFLSKSGKIMVEFLTDIYDSEDNWQDTTKHGGTVEIEKPYLTMLAATTPAWISENFDQTFVEGGFAARVLAVAENSPRFLKAFAEVTPDMLRVRERLVEDLQQISELQGEYIWTPSARDWFEHWYENKWPQQVLDYRLSGYLGRKPSHLIRTAMLVALDKSNELVLRPEHFIQAAELLADLEPRMVRTFASVGRNPYASDLERIASEIESGDGMSRSEVISRNVHAMDKKTLDENLDTLLAMGKITKILRNGEPWYKIRE